MSKNISNLGDVKALETLSHGTLESEHSAVGNEERPRKIIFFLVVSFSLFLLLAACSVFGGGLLLPTFVDKTCGSQKERVIQQMQKIGDALRSYHLSHGRYPATYATDQSGQPACSWRVVITPFLPTAPPVRIPHLSQLWDSPGNAKLGLQIPCVFVSPLVADPPTNTETHVFTVTHPQNPFSEPNRESIASFPTVALPDYVIRKHLLVAYLPNHTAHWAAPVDISLKRLQDEVSNATLESPVILLFTDGSVFAVENPLEPFVVEGFVTGRSKSL